MSIMARIKAPTPKWMKKVRNISLSLFASSIAIMSVPVILPSFVITAASYLALASAVGAAVAQTAVVGDE